MHDKHLFTEEPCNGKLLSTVLESNDSREGVVDFTQIAREAEIGKRYADKLVKVRRIQGEELWLLLHVEVQAQPEKKFAERMFTYNFRIFDRFHQHAISLAILCDASQKWRPNYYSYSYPQTQLKFEFGIVKLLDYENRWQELEAHEGQVEGRQEGRQKGLQEGKQTLILKLLQKRVGELSLDVYSRIQSLSLTQLEALGEALENSTKKMIL